MAGLLLGVWSALTDMNQTTIWTALPNGMDGTKLKLSAHLSVRLAGTPITTLATFPDFKNWPVANLAFKLHFSSGASIPVTPASTVQAGLWPQMFPSDGPVKPFDYVPQAGKEIHTFSAGAVHNYLLEMHGGNALLGGSPYLKPADLYQNPNIANADIYRPGKGNEPTRAGRVDETKIAQAMNQQYGELSQRARKTGGVPTSPQAILWEAKRFFEAYKVPYPFEPPVPDVDFHKALAMLGQHPQLMRAMGVVFDFEFTPPPGVGANGSVWLEVTGSFSTAPIAVYPHTHFEYNPTDHVFRTQAKQGSDTREQVLDMSPGRVDIVEMDINGGVVRAMDFAREVRRMLQMKASDSPEGQPLPSTRSAGVSAIKNNRVAGVMQSLQASDDHDAKRKAAQIIDLYADDVLKGWRPDIWDKVTWFSLCRRDMKYRVGTGGKFEAPDDEGQISMAMSQDPTAPPTAPAKLHESMWTWDGWSLVVPRPGSPIDPNDKLDTSWPRTEGQFNTQFDAGTNQDKHYKFGFFDLPHANSLPSLRFGHPYFMRARAVDLAGNSLPVTTASAFQPKPSFAARDFTYFRFDPVISPTLYEAVARKEGDSANIVVVRLYVSSSNVDPTIRQILPPSSEESMAERHGMLDESTKAIVSPTKWAMVKDVETRPPLTIPIASQVTKPPYLPDPVTLGATLVFEDAANKNKPWILPVKYEGGWPDLHSQKLTLKAATTPMADASISGNQMTVSLLPGQVITARLSTNIFPETLPTFAQFAAISLVLGKNPKVDMAEVKRLVAAGLNHTITPYRDTKLVFATQVPYEKPKMNELGASRPDGASFAILAGDLMTHNWSTVEVDLGAAFEDMVDYLQEDRRATTSIQRNELAFKLKIPRHDENMHYPLRFIERQEFHDTKAHFITYTMTAITRFRDFFPADWLKSNDPSKRFTETAVYEKKVVIPSSKRPESVPLEYIIPTFEWVDSAPGGAVVHERRGNSLRVYMRRPWYSAGNEEKLAVVLMGSGPRIPTMVSQSTEAVSLFMEKYATRIGTDPAFGNAMITQDPTPSNFPGSDPASGTLSVPEYPGIELTAVPFTPGFDEDRQMWYADIDIDTNTAAYTPFVRLALARYQKYSNQGMELSKLITADIVQLAPDRTAVLSVVQPGKLIKVALYGTAGKAMAGPNRAFGTLEVKVGPDDDAGWQPVMLGNQQVVKEIPITPPLRAPVKRGPINIQNVDVARAIGRPAPPPAKKGGVMTHITTMAVSEASQYTSIMNTAGEFDLPGPGTYRVVVREYEQHQSMNGFPQPSHDITFGPTKPAEVATRGVAARLVHLDTLQVP